MRVWIDITNSPHVLFFAPIIRRLEAQGHTVTLTARKYAQTEQLLSRYGLAAVITSAVSAAWVRVLIRLRSGPPRTVLSAMTVHYAG